MNIPHEPVNICAQVGHVITVTLTVRCRHDESVTTRSSTWVDHGTDEQALLYEETHAFGPFDDAEMITAGVNEIHGAAVLMSLAYVP